MEYNIYILYKYNIYYNIYVIDIVFWSLWEKICNKYYPCALPESKTSWENAFAMSVVPEAFPLVTIAQPKRKIQSNVIVYIWFLTF